MRRAFTLIEIIVVISIAGILAVGTFKALEALFVRSVKAKAVTELSLSSQALLNQLGVLLSARVPGSAIGYDPADGSFDSIENLLASKPVLEWLGSAEESMKRREYSGFIDLNASDPVANLLFSPDSDGLKIDASTKLKFSTSADVFATDLVRLVFAGSYDTGLDGITDAFGWHGGGSNKIHKISISSDGNITLGSNPPFIYEKYYLADTAYAVARGADINISAPCITSLGVPVTNNSLFLFYDYRPWKGESFCADSLGNGSGGATLLAEDVAGFRAESVNGVLRLSVDMVRPIRGSTPVHISKQKGLF